MSALDDYSADQIAAVCQKLVRALESEWGLTSDELSTLLGLDHKVSANPELSSHSLERLGLLVSIDRAARSLLPVRIRASAYLRKANSALNGRSVMEMMLSGSVDDLYAALRFLRARLV